MMDATIKFIYRTPIIARIVNFAKQVHKLDLVPKLAEKLNKKGIPSRYNRVMEKLLHRAEMIVIPKILFEDRFLSIFDYVKTVNLNVGSVYDDTVFRIKKINTILHDIVMEAFRECGLETEDDK